MRKNCNIVYYAIIGALLLIIASLITLINLDLNIIDSREFIADISGAIIGAIVTGVFAIFVVNLQTNHNKTIEENRIKENFNTTRSYLIKVNDNISKKLSDVYLNWSKKLEEMNNNPIAFNNDFNLNKSSLEDIISELESIKKNVSDYLLHKNISGMELIIILSLVEAIDDIIENNNVIQQITKIESKPYDVYFICRRYIYSIGKYLSFIDNIKYDN